MIDLSMLSADINKHTITIIITTTITIIISNIPVALLVLHFSPNV